MYLDPQSTLTLFKVNLQLYFRLCDLARESALRWSEAGSRAANSGTGELESAATRMLDAGDWKSLNGIAADLYWKAWQLQTDLIQQVAETSLANQSMFATAAQEAISTWQKDAASSLKETTGAMPISATLQDYFQDYLQLRATPPQKENGAARSKPSSRKTQ
ncbi:hypothetical protein ACFPTX_16010 [Pseudomonas sp. GCM10022188]|uniref:hypothetical protein n=1 Tax=Pseudomonas TaxID=286 RepID=UPI001E29E1DD|nr:hypothetical protein [Pseudomonas oryzagri]MCC6076029.1 hypothetical protein [Pseudomonas oryzagri]